MALIGLLPAVALQTASISVSVDLGRTAPISPYIYGTNSGDWSGRARRLALWRWGGNRTTAYNWENNASNAGTDWFNQNDSLMGESNTPLEGLRVAAAPPNARGAALLITIPTIGYVAADKNGGGDVNGTPNYLKTRFKVSRANKGAKPSKKPDANEGFVNQDEFVYNSVSAFSKRSPVWFALDNEPDLWPTTHPRLHDKKPTYKEVVDKSTEYGKMIKTIAPDSLVFGPASYGWNGYTSLQDAPDANGRDFLDYYLKSMKTASQTAGKRLLDVLDLHWYPEAQGNGQRVTDDGNSPALIEARVQSPRSLWDPVYKEESWITQWSTGGPIKLIPRMRDKIGANYQSTKLAFTEWNYGGGGDISGGVTVADVLGVYGREGVYAAAYWHLKSDESYAYGGFDMFRNFDNAGAKFGDASASVSNPSPDLVSVYASLDSVKAGRRVFVLVNKSLTDSRTIELSGVGAATSIRAYSLYDGSSSPRKASVKKPVNGFLKATLPKLSVMTVELRS